MSIKKKVFAAAATMTLVGGLSAVGLLPAVAQTPSCGDNCETIFGDQLGPAFILDVLRQGEKVGQPIIQFRNSYSDPAEDFVYNEQGPVSDFFAAGLVSSALDLHYGGAGCESGYTGTPPTCAIPYPDYNAFELEYAPYGVDSGLCAGTGTTAGNGTPVALEPCGVSGKTVWVEDTLDGAGNGAIPLINGSDTNFSHPYVLQYPGNAYPTDMPRPQLTTHMLQQYSSGDTYDNELWLESGGIDAPYAP